MAVVVAGAADWEHVQNHNLNLSYLRVDVLKATCDFHLDRTGKRSQPCIRRSHLSN